MYIIKNNLIATGFLTIMSVAGLFLAVLIFPLAEKYVGFSTVLIAGYTILVLMAYFACGRFFIQVDGKTVLMKAISCIAVLIVLLCFVLIHKRGEPSIFLSPFYPCFALCYRVFRENGFLEFIFSAVSYGAIFLGTLSH